MINLSGIKRIHCIGIGGIGLSALAQILNSRGYDVSGSDMKQSEMTDKLQKQGITVFIGHNADNVEGAQLLVYSNAVSDENPELIRAKEMGIPAVTRAQLLGTVMDDYPYSVAISGTHGKTTTTSMISLILSEAQKDPTILVGGNLSEINGNVQVGNSGYFVTEACEYMDSFLSLSPKIEIILNIDSDHLDYFKDIDHIVDSFTRFADLVPENGVIIAYDANPFVSSAVSDHENIITFGFGKSCTYHIHDVKFNANGMPYFKISKNGSLICEIQLKVPGEHNILNAAASVACCDYLGVDRETIQKTLENYTGTQRRFDVIGELKTGIKIVDDYAHHPTEIKATLKAACNIPHKNLWCIFQPHTYTRTKALFGEFAEAFQLADKLVLAEIYAAREKNIYKISSRELMQKIKEEHPDKEVYYFGSFEEIANFVYNNAMPGDMILTMGAGDVYKIGNMIMERDSKA